MATVLRDQKKSRRVESDPPSGEARAPKVGAEGRRCRARSALNGRRGVSGGGRAVDADPGPDHEAVARGFVDSDEAFLGCAADPDVGQRRVRKRLVSAQSEPWRPDRHGYARLSHGGQSAFLCHQVALFGIAQLCRGVQLVLPARLSAGDRQHVVRAAEVQRFLPGGAGGELAVYFFALPFRPRATAFVSGVVLRRAALDDGCAVALSGTHWRRRRTERLSRAVDRQPGDCRAAVVRRRLLRRLCLLPVSCSRTCGGARYHAASNRWRSLRCSSASRPPEPWPISRPACFIGASTDGTGRLLAATRWRPTFTA